MASGLAPGDSSALGIGITAVIGVGNAPGDSAATGIGGSVATGTAPGSSSASGIGVAAIVSTGTAPGDSSASGIGVAAIVSTGTAPGDSSASGVGSFTFFLGYTGSGGVHVGGSSPYTVNYTWVFSESWNVNGIITLETSFTWDDGEQPMKWYRVEGCCRYPTSAGSGLPPPNNQPGGCSVIPFQSQDSKCEGALGRNTFMQVIAAHNLSEVCQILTAMNWQWPICGISVFSTPADNRFVTPDMTCNKLTDLAQPNWCSLPACRVLCLQTHGITDMAMDATGGIIFFQYVGSGGVHVGGAGKYAPLTGGITTGPNWQYRGIGGVHVGGDA